MPSDVICRACGGVYLETNDEDGFLLTDDGTRLPDPRVKRFDPDAVANGAMLRLKEPYRSYGWSCFAHCVSQVRDALVCPSCETPLPDLSGHVRLANNGNGNGKHPEQKIEAPLVPKVELAAKTRKK